MDPQQRMLLETTWHALEDAGIDPETLRRSRTGFYVGLGTCEYRAVIAAKGEEDLYFGTSGSLTAGRVAFVLGLEGPAMPVDMACASSLAALHQAVAALQRGEVDLDLAGGVNTTLSMALARFHRDMGCFPSPVSAMPSIPPPTGLAAAKDTLFWSYRVWGGRRPAEAEFGGWSRGRRSTRAASGPPCRCPTVLPRSG